MRKSVNSALLPQDGRFFRKIKGCQKQINQTTKELKKTWKESSSIEDRYNKIPRRKTKQTNRNMELREEGMGKFIYST